MGQEKVIRVQGLFGEVVWTLPPNIAKILLEMKGRDEEILNFMEAEKPETAKLLKEKFNGSAYKMFDDAFTRMLKGQFQFFVAMLAVPSYFWFLDQEIAESSIKLLKKAKQLGKK